MTGLAEQLSVAPTTGEQREVLQEFTPAMLEKLRDKCRTDLYFLAKSVLGYDQLEIGAHAALCRWLVEDQSDRRMLLMSRGFLKTTIATVADSVRLPLINPNIRILLQNEASENAATFLDAIKQQWMKNDLLRSIFPELIPDRVMGPGSDWSKFEASIRRGGPQRESTWTASGSGGSPQSKHFEVIKNDDLIGEKAKESDAEMQRAIRWCDSMEPLLDRLTNRIDWYGTRKTLADAYAHVQTSLGDRLSVFVREPLENDQTIFSKFPTEKLVEIMTNKPDMWAHDYMNNPLGKGGLDWGHTLLRMYHMTGDDEVYLEHHITQKVTRWKLHELDIVMMIDPNSGKLSAPDKAAITVIGVTPDEQIVVLQAWSARVSPDGLIDQAWTMAKRWRPRTVGCEDAGQQNTMYYMEKRGVIEGQFFRLVPLKHNNRSKEPRIRAALDTPLKARRVYVLSSMITLRNQIGMFPQLAPHNWDEIDALSYFPDIAGVGARLADIEAEEDAEAKVLEMRGLTGYGSSVSRGR